MHKIKLLIAEDDGVTQMFYEKGISDDFFITRIVSNGEEAVTVYQSWQPDIVVLDINMPVKSGYVALKEIRKIEENLKKKVVIIMASSLSGKEDVPDCAKLGIQNYIIKPFKIREINSTLIKIYQKFISPLP